MTVARSFASIKKDRDFGRKSVARSCASIKKDRDFRRQAVSSRRIAILANDRCQELCLDKQGS